MLYLKFEVKVAIDRSSPNDRDYLLGVLQRAVADEYPSAEIIVSSQPVQPW